MTALMVWPGFHSKRAEPQGAKQIAAPAETRTPNMHRAKRIAPRECGWKHGDSGPLGGKKQTLFNEKRNNPLDSDRPSHGRPLHSEPRSGHSECYGDVSSIIMGWMGQRVSMPRIRHAVASLWLIGLFCVWFASAQDVPGVNETDLEVVRTGHFRTKSGHAIPFRVLKAPDVTEAQILHTRFNSLEAAELQIEEWVEATRTVTSREHNQTKAIN